jgi:fructosamine-3-kinase
MNGLRTLTLGSGPWGTVRRVQSPDGSRVIKTSPRVDLRIEARMLAVLAAVPGIPVPRVYTSTRSELVLEDLPGTSSFSQTAQRHGAELLADLHANLDHKGRYGLDFDNLIGPLPQPNGWLASWVEFFRDRRLLSMTGEAAREGAIPSQLASELERLGARLGDLIPEDPPSSLLHGDLWSGNILAEGDRITGLLDPSVYHGHAEMELAFITLFSTFGDAFFTRYHELRPIDPPFWETRRGIYNLYPLLVHARLFGGHYVDQVAAAVRPFV